MKRLSMIMVCLLAMMSASLNAKAQEVTITLYPGWTWISYPNAETMDISSALGDFVPASGDIIQSQYSSSTYVNGYWRGGITHFMPGWGYMYYSNRTEVVSFVFGEAAPQITVTTAEPTEITANSAVSGGSITSNDGNYVFVLEKGICWATHPNPMVMNDFFTQNGNGPDDFTTEMTDLAPNTMYYVRAYAVTLDGTTYSEELSFTTRDGIPEVSTNVVTNIIGNRAICGGTVIDNGGLDVSARGVCWSLSSNPIISDNHTIDGDSLGDFTSNITGLIPNTTYYVRAYASTSQGTGYGEEVSFTTLDIPAGAMNSLFSVSETKQVYFSHGNLQYQASTNTWRFAEDQWCHIGSDNANISESYSGWIDLFAWGTSGYNHGAVCYEPYSLSYVNNDYFAYGNRQYNLFDRTGQADWGYNAISNGGNQENSGWRTPTVEEWAYLINFRNTASGIRWAQGNVGDNWGIILLPDSWDSSIYELDNPNGVSNSNIITNEDWINAFDNNGAIFLPGAGYRYWTQASSPFYNWYFMIDTVGIYYWTSTGSDYGAHCAHFIPNLDIIYGHYDVGLRCNGFSVRLVKDYNQ